ncbi:MAG TPA: CBM35 domain-containing protein [Actinophytocola sp.]|uniref:CBM35 domain-containing protein n=1 Tax=Actinophytocola sp. TaxID=1872138 RepID=UPI002DDCD339|nr:CBM35 domain-containing protein [Actinophytocola sp.]HEV2784352.1 CBM35 domain-containing protein [Actinophytocola sp.]
MAVLVGAVAVAEPVSAAPTRYEAEDAVISQGVVEANHAGFSGTGFVNYDNVAGGYVEFTVTAAQAGNASLIFRFANGTTADRPMNVTVNGVTAVAGQSFPGTGAWTAWQSRIVTANLDAGTNTVRATATTANGGPNLDFLEVDPAAPAVGLEAEDAVISQGVVEANHAGFSGTGFVNYDNVAGGYVEFTVTAAQAGIIALAFRYANGTGVDRPMAIAVNGVTAAASLSFPGAGAWTTWQTRSVTVNLDAGANTIRATATTANGGPNLDRLTVGVDTPPAPAGMAAAPYEYLGWGNPQRPTDVMAATGVRWFTLAFILSDGTCNPAWDGSRSLTGGADQASIDAIRAAGGDVIVSFGGWSGRKLGEFCSSASALAGAYQRVINAYRLKAIDIDIENTEFGSATVRQRVIDALKIVKASNPGIVTLVTFGTTPNGPDATGRDLINRGAAAGLDNDGWIVMPFDFDGHTGTMGQASVSAMEGLKAAVKSAYGYGDDAAYRHIGLSSMNGRTDVAGETVTLDDFRLILTYARQHHIVRFAFWSINRDRPCTAGSDADACSGIAQQPYGFTKIVVQYTG